MNIDFIKWMCDKADGFEITNESKGFLHTDFFSYHKSGVNGSRWTDLVYPLLLQRAIEGVNESDGNHFIIQGPGNIGVKKNNQNMDLIFAKESASDSAKQSALEYIYNQEQTS